MKNRKPGGGTFFVNEESSDSQQVHHMPQRHEAASSSIYSTTDTSTSMSKTSISSSISRFRNDFDDLKCKMRIFGESLNLCHCIANDFQNRISLMERRLQRLEDRHRLTIHDYFGDITRKNANNIKKLMITGKIEGNKPAAVAQDTGQSR
ncbi:jg22680 [Pararge aegeria aegeria]|uniref:Jg22680 protein n=1 Tax=Pararge aegeria aegeria TaxID=348720 RepID=A0A8S4RZU5_9NEOP|nr:jg22680 [Pararge aegeria aegeria]